MFPKRHQQNWKRRADNSILHCHATQVDVKNIYSFWQKYNDYLSEFVFNAIEMQKNIKFDQSILIVDNTENLMILFQILKQQKFIFIDIITQNQNSYKGYITYIIIATYNKLYLIDSAKLHDQCYQFKSILQKKSLIKFMHQCQQILDCFKRDFQIFMPNIFDLQVVQRYLVKKGKLPILPKQKFRQFIYSNPHQKNKRPAKQQLIWKVKEYYEQQMNFLINLDKFFSTQDPEYNCYQYFNHYQLLCKSYYHHVPTVYQIDQILTLKNQKKDKPFNQYKKHHEIGNIVIKQQNGYWIKQKQEIQVTQLIYNWKEHIAKMKDVSSEQLLTYQIISKLSKSNISSVLQISELYNNKYNTRPFSLSIEQLEQILQIFQLYKQQRQQFIHELSIPKRLPFYKTNQQKPIKQLFQELKFNDLGNQWLNKKNDDSLKLYKEILSINQFDNSIVQEYLIDNQISSQNKPEQSLQIEDINKFIKYAQYLRNGNHKRLQQLYQKQKNKLQQYEKDEQQENFIQGQQISNKNWDDIQSQINFPTMDTINQIKSTSSFTSLHNHSNVTINSCKVLPNCLNSSILLQNKMNSLNIIQSPIYQHNKIQSLPQNIQNIYKQAAKAKKIYCNKGLKKNNKTTKKQSKTNIQSNKNKKDQELIPKKQQIFNLIHY